MANRNASVSQFSIDASRTVIQVALIALWAFYVVDGLTNRPSDCG